MRRAVGEMMKSSQRVGPNQTFGPVLDEVFRQTHTDTNTYLDKFVWLVDNIIHTNGNDKKAETFSFASLNLFWLIRNWVMQLKKIQSDFCLSVHCRLSAVHHKLIGLSHSANETRKKREKEETD